MHLSSRVTTLLALLCCSCGNNFEASSQHADASPPDAALADAATHDAAAQDADAGPAPDAGDTGMVISSVVLDGSFSQVHQSATFELVVTGSGLGAVTDIAFDDGLISEGPTVTPTQVSAVFYVNAGATPGPRDVTLVAPTESATAMAAFEVTPWVFGPGAPPGGRGTFESPLALAAYFDGAGPGDTFLLLAGEHRSDGVPYADGPVSILGQGVATTVVRGDLGSFGGFQIGLGQPQQVSVVRDIAFIGSGTSRAVFSNSGVDIIDVAAVGAGIELSGSSDPFGVSSTARLERFDFDGLGGGGSGLHAQGRLFVQIADSAFRACGSGTGIFLDDVSGALLVEDVLVEGCARGIVARSPVDPEDSFLPLDVEVRTSQLIDNVDGIETRGEAAISDTVVEGNAVSLPSRRGIVTLAGGLNVTDTIITGQTLRGVEQDFQQNSGFVLFAATTLRRVSITGGEIGVHSHGAPDDAAVYMRDCVVRDQTVASVQLANEFDSYFDLGNDGVGGNELSVSSGFALVDLRTDLPPFMPVEAEGITLNGNSYTGLVQGPVEVPPDYRLVGDGFIQF